MRITKTKIVLISLLTLAIIMAAIGMLQAYKLQKQLAEAEKKEAFMKNLMASQSKLKHIDSMLVKGQYHSALKAYRNQLKDAYANDPTDVKLRIELAQQLVQFAEITKPLDSIANLKAMDSSQVRTGSTSREIREIDSLRFALEKSKLQLNRLKKRIKNSTGGDYLTFKNLKKHQLHYVGEVRNKKANGFGIAILDTGSRYEGEWQDNVRHGQGSFYWVDGEKYIGGYQNDLRNGTGTYFWPNGEKYVGQWKNDQRDGEGVFYGKNGKVITKGIWKNDKLVEEKKQKKK